MEISIIIPTFNRWDSLLKVINSYLIQKFVYEFIIVDDGSTLPIPKELTKVFTQNNIHYYRFENRQGITKVRNKGIEISKARLILMGEDDVMLTENYVEYLLNILLRYDADIIGGRIIGIQEGQDINAVIIKNYEKDIKIIDPLSLEGNFHLQFDEPIQVPFLHAVCLIKRSCFEITKYDTNFWGNAYREESDFCLSIVKQGGKCLYESRAVCYHVSSDSNQVGGHRRNRVIYDYMAIRNNYYFLNKHYEFLNSNNISRKSKAYLNIYFILARVIKRLKGIFSYILRKIKAQP